MTLRPEYALGHSRYNAFLFASVGEEGNGLSLTVLTALTRLGLDPWQEAARLSDLPRETAARALAATIATSPEGDWKASDSGVIATRLVDWLPGRSAPAVPLPMSSPVSSSRVDASKTGSLAAGRWLVWGAVAVAVVCLTLYLQPDNNLEPAARAGVSMQK
ncbi:MAG: hypothetical protein A3D94_12720 [Alphaproteobacteria bacterium RIFCSPHIGHO2_12_FULL_66_14]|nr:MAG: hypothetical protein A3D94_12720 [Alphaproteobacteria bacterium RIFCSPHIGHO2_12_FULL_66_14]